MKKKISGDWGGGGGGRGFEGKTLYFCGGWRGCFFVCLLFQSSGRLAFVKMYNFLQEVVLLKKCSSVGILCSNGIFWNAISVLASLQPQELTDAQADLSLRWAHMRLCWFCHEAAQSIREEWCSVSSWGWRLGWLDDYCSYTVIHPNLPSGHCHPYLIITTTTAIIIIKIIILIISSDLSHWSTCMR